MLEALEQGGVEQAASLRTRILGDVVCGVNGSRGSYEAVRQAAGLAGPDARLTLVAVTAVRGAGPQRTASIAPARARRALLYARQLAVDAGVKDVTVEIDDGYPVVETLLDDARGHGLLAIGAPLMPRVAHLLVGGTATRAAHLLPTSLLVVRRAPTGVRFAERIIVATDGSSASNGLVDFASELALERDASLMLVHAFRGDPPDELATIDSQAERAIRILGARVSLRVDPDRPLDLILATTVRERCSLVVVASRRLSGLRALGSVSERLVHEAPCSILVVRPEDLRGGVSTA
jgi:nucleotide-binding universal stress UspA family protein